MKKLALILAITLLLSACAGQPAQSTQSKPAASISTSQSESAVVSKKIMPLPATLNIDTLSDATVTASFEAKDLSTSSAGFHSLFLTVYDYELFDLVDISTMAVGDTIVIEKKEVKIDTVEKKASGYTVNGGIENDGFDLFTDDNTVYYQIGMDNRRFFFDVGQAPFNISDNFQLTDNSDLENPNQKLDYDAFEKKLQAGETRFDESNTTVLIKDGDIVEITLSFVP